MPGETKSLKDIFLAALERETSAERATYLDTACQGDNDLRQRVEAMLRAHDQPDPLLDRPATEQLLGKDGSIPLDFLTPTSRPGGLGRLGTYEVLDVVGQGGTGIVLRAFDEKLQRVVAIKVLAPFLAVVGSARQRFVREARAVAAINHDNVIAIHAVEDAGSVPYLVMQYIDGCTLQQKLDRTGPLPVREILRLSLGIAEGLAAAHRHGLVHRDVKPANILLENGVERVKLTDFGLARAADDASITQSGVIAGTPAYMSPEQANGDRIDHRSDLFSLGSVMYALCTGHAPFRADTTMAVLKRVCEGTPRPIGELNPEIPEWLASMIGRLQAKSPSDRFETANEVATLLSERLSQLQSGGTFNDEGANPWLARSEPTRSGPTRVRRLFTSRRLSGVLGVVVLAGLASSLWLPHRLSFTPEAVTILPDPVPSVVRRPPTADDLAKLPDSLDDWQREKISIGSLASVADAGAEALPALVGVLGDSPFRLPRREQTHWPTQSPNGRLLALPCGMEVVIYDAATGAIVRILKGQTGPTFVGDFTKDSKRFACGSVDGFIRVWDIATGKVELSFQDGANNVWTTLISPDQQRIVTGGVEGDVKVWDAADGNALKTLGRHEGGASCMAFNESGTRLATAGIDRRVKLWEWPTGKLLETLEGNPEMIQCIAFNHDGTLLASGCNSRVIVWDVATLRPRRTFNTPGGGLLGFTPDGRTLVTGPHSSFGQRRPLTRWDLESGKRTATLELPGTPGQLVGRLSHDGRTVFMMGYVPPDSLLGAYDAITGANQFLDQEHTAPVTCVAFSPDGRLAASGDLEGRVWLWNLTPMQNDFAKGRLFTSYDRPVHALAFSPDGQHLASSSFDGTVRLADRKSGQIVQEYFVGQSPTPAPLAFSPDGEILGAGGDNGCVYLWSVKTAESREPLRWHVGHIQAIAFSPDGRWLASAGHDKLVQLIDLGSGKREHSFRGSTAFTSLAFSPDSQALAAASNKSGSFVWLWNLATRTEKAVSSEKLRVTGLAFDPQGDRLATTSVDGAIRLWDLSLRGDRNRTLKIHHKGPAGAVAFTTSGRHLAVGLSNGLIPLIRTPNSTPR